MKNDHFENSKAVLIELPPIDPPLFNGQLDGQMDANRHVISRVILLLSYDSHIVSKFFHVNSGAV